MGHSATAKLTQCVKKAIVRVHFEDGTYTAVVIRGSTTAGEVSAVTPLPFQMVPELT